MDLRAYYRRVREVADRLTTADVIVVSCETPDGGRAGIKTEVPSRIAATLIVEGRARLATEEELSEYRTDLEVAGERAKETAAAGRIRIAVIPESDLKPKKAGTREEKQAGR